MTRPGLGIASLLALLAAGCAGPRQQLTLHSARTNQSFAQPFAHAYLTRESGGDADVVLVDDACEQSLKGARSNCPVRQVMHIRVLWQPLRDIHADHSSASNATIHWYVMGNSPGNSADMLEYAGNGFVLVEGVEGGAKLTLRNANLRPVARRGELADPVGTSTLQGSIRAIEDRHRLREVLNHVRSAVAAANALPGNLARRPNPESPSSSAR